jgi:hypothetical protein
MANYNVYYSDPGKTTPIVVVDGTLNTSDTSIKLVGQNYPGYGPALSEDLVHILENFASSSPPNNPIEGQLWFNTSDPLNKKLFVNDGTAYQSSWSPVNGVHQEPSAPTNANIGDIWVDTTQQQLNIWNGSGWILVGPAYSGTSKTGPYATAVTDVTGVSNNIIINYVNGNAIEIISPTAFTPLQSIDGFPQIKSGINVTTKNFGTTQSPILASVNGTANSAKALLQSSSTAPVIADNFARLDIAQTFASVVTFGDNNDRGILIGSTPTFAIQRQNQYDATFLNTFGSSNTSGGRFVFKAIKNNITAQLLTVDGNSNQVYVGYPGITNADLTVEGGITASTKGTFDQLVVNSSTSSNVSTITNALYVNGGAGIGGDLLVTGEHILKKALTVGANPITAPANPQISLIVPSQTNIYNIGDTNLAFRNIYASTFTGPGGTATFAGNATTAAALSSPQQFTIQGGIEAFSAQTNSLTSIPFNGSSPVTFQTRATPDLIYLAKGGTTATTRVSDQIMIYRQAQDQYGNNIPDTGASGNGTVYRQQKSDFLQDLYFGLIQTGCVIPFAGPSNKLPSFANNTNYPSLDDPTRPAWLLCDGTAYDGSLPTSPYYNLYQVIGIIYGGTGPGNFKVPDLRNQGLASNQGTGPYLNYLIKT